MDSCKNCTDRHIGCHGECERYKQDCVEREILKEKIRKKREYDTYAKQVYADRKDRQAKQRYRIGGMSKFGTD